jgi:DNA-binding Xre family transcriptional regulator
MITATDRKVFLLRRGVTITALTKALGYKSAGNVSNAINGTVRNAKLEKAICAYLGVELQEWFPSEPTASVEQAA